MDNQNLYLVHTVNKCSAYTWARNEREAQDKGLETMKAPVSALKSVQFIRAYSQGVD